MPKSKKIKKSPSTKKGQTKKNLSPIIKNTAFICLVISLASLGGFFAYKDYQSADEIQFIFSKEVSAVRTHQRPEGEDTSKYTLYLDDEEVIVGAKVKGLDPWNTDKYETYSFQLTEVLTGKKLSDLEAIDKVGTSSISTKAFNDTLEELKSQL